MEFIDNRLRTVNIDGSAKYFIWEDGVKTKKKENSTLTYGSESKHIKIRYTYVGNLMYAKYIIGY